MLNMDKYRLQGHGLAACCAFFWGTAYIGSKVLVSAGFPPTMIILLRQSLAYLLLFLFTRNRLSLGGLSGLKRDRYLILSGITGAALYYLLESTALSYTYATNVSLMVATSPIFAAILNCFLPGGQRTPLKRRFFVGLGFCLLGVGLVIFNGSQLHLNPLGDCIGLLAALSWAAYSFFLHKAQQVNAGQAQPLSDLLLTRRTLFYGGLFILLVFILSGPQIDPGIFRPRFLLVLTYLAAFPSACAFFFWGKAITRIGMLQSCLYVDLSPLIAVSSAALLLGEGLTWASGLGMAGILLGLALSQGFFSRRELTVSAQS